MGKSPATAKEVEETIALIKAQMPETYKSIQAKADAVGKIAFALVRRGIKGEPNCFWACERGYVVGAPFADSEIERDIAHLMVQFGSTFVCIWGREAAHVAN
jgi:hypothetical protein